MKRKLIYSPEYIAFYEQTTLRVQEKLQYATSMLEIINVVPTKFIKKLSNTDFYEMRISVENEVRIILFAVDHENINLASTIIFLNGFIKKGTKDYKREISRAINILRNVL
jgi:hypothetical protein